MTDKEKTEFQELQGKHNSGTLTADEQSRFDELSNQHTLQTEIKSALQTFMAETGLLKSLANQIPDGKSEPMNNPGYVFHKMLCGIKQNKPEWIKTASPMTEGTPGDGGYLVPALTESMILERIPTYGQARRFMTVLPMSGNVLNMPKQNALPTAYWVGENETISDSKPTLTQQTLTPKKLAGLVIMSNELFADANVSIGNYILSKMAEVFGVAEDSQFFDGSGSPMTGIFATGNTFGNLVTFSGNGTTVSYDNLVDIADGVDANYLTGAGWFMSRSYRSTIRKIKDDQHMPIATAYGNEPMTLFGYPVNVVENAPSTATASNKPGIILGNLQNSIIGDVAGIRVDFLKEATIDGVSLAENDLVAIRCIKRVAFTPGYTEKYSVGRQAV